MARIAILLVAATVCAAGQPAGGWLAAVRDRPLAALVESFEQHPWPALHAAPAPLALALHDRVRKEESVRTSTVESRLRAYATIANHLRAAGGYSNSVLANALTVLGVYHIGRRLAAAPSEWQRARAEHALFNFSLLEAQAAGDDDSGVRTGDLLRNKNPAALANRIHESALQGDTVLPSLIAFLEQGGKLDSMDNADAVSLLSGLRSLDSPLLAQALDRPFADTGALQIRETVLGALPAGGIEVSSDGRHFRYVATAPAGQQLVIDGKRGPVFTAIGRVITNRQGSRTAYVAKRSDAEVVVVDGVPQRSFESVPGGDLLFSPDGNHYAYIGCSAGRDTIILDGRELASFTDAIGLEFTPDSRRLAYFARRNGAWYAVNGASEEGPFESVDGPRGITFSPDGRTWAFYAVKRLFVIGGEGVIEFPVEQLLQKPVFSPDGKRIGVLEMFPSTNRFSVIDLNTAQVERHVDARQFLVTGDLRTVRAANGRRGETAEFVAAMPADDLALDAFVAADGRHVASAAREDDKVIVKRDGQALHEFANNGIEPCRLSFDPTGKHLVYAGPRGATTIAICVDGKEVAYVDALPAMGKVHWDSPDRFHLLAVRYGEVVLVDVTIP